MSFSRWSRCRLVLAGLLAVVMLPVRAFAIGWLPGDFLINGGSSFTSKIAVYDSNLNYKGLLDPSFGTVAGMDFDAAGHLVAVGPNASGNQVRVYDSTGATVGGFHRSDQMLGSAIDLKVTASGNYIVATQNFGGGDGAREFTPAGDFVRQYGTGATRGVAVLPGNVVWTGAPGVSSISAYSTIDGHLLSNFSVPGMSGDFSSAYSPLTQTVLLVDGHTGFVLETDLNGSLRQSYTATGLDGPGSCAFGPTGDVYMTDTSKKIYHWTRDGTFVGAVSTSSDLGYSFGIINAGTAPEPSGVGAIFVLIACRCARRR